MVNIIHGHLKNHFDKCFVILDILMPISSIMVLQYVKNDTREFGIFIVAVIPQFII